MWDGNEIFHGITFSEDKRGYSRLSIPNVVELRELRANLGCEARPECME